jgi:hypothetical protein
MDTKAIQQLAEEIDKEMEKYKKAQADDFKNRRLGIIEGLLLSKEILQKAAAASPQTKYGHLTKKPLVVPGYEQLVREDNYSLTYLRTEYNHQIERMRALGINVEAQMFEQCVNTLLYMLERPQDFREAPQAIPETDVEEQSAYDVWQEQFGDYPVYDVIKFYEQKRVQPLEKEIEQLKQQLASRGGKEEGERGVSPNALPINQRLLGAFEGMILHALPREIPVQDALEIVEKIKRKMSLCGITIQKAEGFSEPQ